MCDEGRNWKSVTWVWCLIAAVIVIASLSVGISVLSSWIKKNGPNKLPEASELGGPTSADGNFEQPSNEAWIAQQQRALAIARDTVKARETWYDVAEFLSPYATSDGGSIVSVIRPGPKGGNGPHGAIVIIKIDKDGKVVWYRRAPI
jgi:hypothetical protein